MRSLVVLCFLSFSLLAFMVYQAAIQELSIQTNTARVKLAKELEKVKQNEIWALKAQVSDVQREHNNLGDSEDQLAKQMEQVDKDTADSQKSIETCRAEKQEKENQRAKLTDILEKLREAQEAEKVKAQEDIQKLKQQLLDRDQAICAFVDKAQPEGMKLCGL
ncbi:myosin-14-like [Engraulis encrasicolus]|uniref:myosin-14-like n=1 Tax=Engraulis encrasicolus TaxID=184585 RepID=UPI002FD79DFC